MIGSSSNLTLKELLLSLIIFLNLIIYTLLIPEKKTKSIIKKYIKKFLILFKNKEKIISDSTLVAITLLLAESKPEEKEIMINVIINFLEW